MGTPSAGSVVLVPFPFLDLWESNARAACETLPQRLMREFDADHEAGSATQPTKSQWMDRGFLQCASQRCC